VIAATPPIAYFAHLPPGWHQYAQPPGDLALSWRYRSNPHGWASTMPKGGIAVSVFFPHEKPHYPRLRLILPKHPATVLEGAPDTPEYRIHGRVRGVDVEVWIDIHQRHPTRRQRRLAQRTISAIRFR